jgi:hypothetical protein
MLLEDQVEVTLFSQPHRQLVLNSRTVYSILRDSPWHIFRELSFMINLEALEAKNLWDSVARGLAVVMVRASRTLLHYVLESEHSIENEIFEVNP